MAGGVATTSEVIATVLARHREVADELTAANEAAWAATDPVLLELCRVRIAMLLGCEAEQGLRTPAALAAGLDEAAVAELAQWPTSGRFGPRERACLAFCEQFVIDVATISDEQARAVSDALGPEHLADFVSALLVVEQRQRLRLAWAALGLDAGSGHR